MWRFLTFGVGQGPFTDARFLEGTLFTLASRTFKHETSTLPTLVCASFALECLAVVDLRFAFATFDKWYVSKKGDCEIPKVAPLPGSVEVNGKSPA